MDENTLQEVKEKILSGETTLRSAASELKISRDKLKQLLEQIVEKKEEAENFRDRMKYNKANSATIPIDEKIQNAVIEILKGKRTAKEVSQTYGLDRETIRRKINALIQLDNSLLKDYINYLNKSGRDYGNINFKGLIVFMIKSNMSQSEMASEYDIPARTISREVQKLGKSEKKEDQKLYNIAKIYADRKMKHEEITVYERELYTSILEELFQNVPIIEEKSKIDREIEQLEDFMEQVRKYQQQNMTAEKIAEQMNSSISTIRRNRLKLQELKQRKEISEKLGEIEEGR